jgi:hypothetical protein
MGRMISIVSVVTLAGCAPTATIVRAHDAPSIEEARIVSSDDKNLYVEQDMLDGHVEKTSIPRREIVTIHHPGLEAAYVGGALVVVGATSIVYGFIKGGKDPTCSGDNGPCADVGWVATGVVEAVFGVIAIVAGEVIHQRSVKASEPAHASIRFMPTGLTGVF